MLQWLMEHGAYPVILPPFIAGFTAETVLDGIDGLLLAGGTDVAPEGYGEEPLRPEWSGDRYRDVYEFALVEEAMKQDIPIIGICRGHQVLNVALGGSLYQDTTEQLEGVLVHRNWDIYDENQHDIVFEADSVLNELYPGLGMARVNSVHHQSIKELAPGLVCEARSVEDDIIEAVRYKPEDPDAPYAVGVQWHPEFMDPSEERWLNRDPLMEDFLDAVRARTDNPSD
jgi:putative glutamine amidotransferase